MVLRGRNFRISTLICLIAYYGIAYWLPRSYSPLLGGQVNTFALFYVGIFLNIADVMLILKERQILAAG